MSFFGVTRERIGEIREHEGADRLQIAKLEGINFQFVIGKDSYKVGDEVLYFPIDSVLPLNTAKAVGLEGKLAGKNKDRVKTVRLRGEISQGVVAPLTILKNPEETNTELITQELGVTKYDPPPVPCKAGKLVPLPFGMSAYDIEGAERNMDVLEQLMDVPVVITEKLEGQNFSISWDGTTQSIHVNQRNYSIQPLEDKEHELLPEDLEYKIEVQEGFAGEESEGYLLLFNSAITEELKQEGYVRDIIRRVQTMRKELDLEYTQKILLTLETDEFGKSAVENHIDFLKEETLSKELTLAKPIEGHVKEWEFDNYKVSIGIVQL